jgi:hypothetical protein
MLLDFVIIMSRNRVPFMNYVPGELNKTPDDYLDFDDTVTNKNYSMLQDS